MKLDFTGSAIDYAKSVTPSDLKRVIKSIKKGEYDEFDDRCRVCFEKYLAGDITQAEWWSNHAELARLKR